MRLPFAMDVPMAAYVQTSAFALIHPLDPVHTAKAPLVKNAWAYAMTETPFPRVSSLMILSARMADMHASNKTKAK